MSIQYEVKILGYENSGDNILYKINILDMQTMEQREIRLRYSQFLEMHNTLQNNNYQSQLPPFPKKEFFKNLFGESSLVKQREQMLGEYFIQLLRSPPPHHKCLNDFLRDSVDVIRQQDLTKEVYQKSDYLKGLKFIQVLKKSQFGKTTLLESQNKKKVILHKFYVPNYQNEQLFNQYFKTHVGFTEFNYITQVYSIFYFKQKVNLVDSMFGVSKPPKTSKKQRIFQSFCVNNQRIEACKIFSLEEYEGINLDEIIKKRKIKQIPFTFEELLNFAQKLLEAIMFLHKKMIITNRIFSTSIILHEDNVKLTGILEPNERYKEKYLLEGNAQRTEMEYDIVYYPSEKLSNNAYQSINPLKIDAWQFGISLLKAALLLNNQEIGGIQYDNIKFVKLVQAQYGDVIAEILELSLKNPAQQRADIKELFFLVNQTSIIPFNIQFLQKEIQVGKILQLTDADTIEQIAELLQKNSYFGVRIKMMSKENDKNLEQIMQLLSSFGTLRECIIIGYKINVTSLFSCLADFKSVQKLNIDLKGSQIIEDDIVYIVQTLKEMKLTHLTLDCSSLPLLNQLKGLAKVFSRFYYDSQLIQD